MPVGRRELTGFQVVLYGIPVSALAAVYNGQHVMDLVRFRQRFQNGQRRCIVVHRTEGYGGIVILIGPQNLDGRLIVAVPDGLHTGHVFLIQHGGLDGILHHSFPVEMEIKLHGTEPRVEHFAEEPVVGFPGEHFLPGIKVPNLTDVDVFPLLVGRQ